MILQVNGVVGHAVEEKAVMRDDDERRGQVVQKILQPLQRGDVQMVGRLVQQQQVGIG